MPDDREQTIEELDALRRRVAELEAAQQSWIAADDQYKNLFRYSGESILIVDPSTLQFLDVNTNAARRLGYSREEMLSLTLRDVEVHDPDDGSDAMAWESGVSGTMFYECCYVRKNGAEIPVEVSSRLARFGERYVLLNFVRDISKRKEMERALREYQQQLEAQNEELRAFNHTVAHDLKSPLTSIIGYADLLLYRIERTKPDQQREYLETIVRVGSKMGSIIEELLLLAGVREQAVQREPLDMAAIVAEALQRLSHEIAHAGAEIVLPPDGAWPVALGYGPWVEEVWTNYVSNALKYGGQPPRVELGATVIADSPAGERLVRFWATDNGPGLSPEDQAKLFAPFERLHQVRIQGHGLGLSIVRRIVEKLGGQAGVESMPGAGSTFYFVLPGP